MDMEKLYNAMPQGYNVKSQKVLELNRKHPVYARLEQFLADGQGDALSLYTNLLYQQARIIAGLPLDDPITFAKNISKLMTE